MNFQISKQSMKMSVRLMFKLFDYVNFITFKEYNMCNYIIKDI